MNNTSNEVEEKQLALTGKEKLVFQLESLKQKWDASRLHVLGVIPFLANRVRNAGLEIAIKILQANPEASERAIKETMTFWSANAEDGFNATNAENALRKEFGLPLIPKPKSPLMKLRRIVKVTAIIFVLAGLVPPWVQTRDGGDAGYAFILTPPQNVRVRLDTPRLMVEWACILAVAGVVWFLSATKEAKSAKTGSNG